MHDDQRWRSRQPGRPRRSYYTGLLDDFVGEEKFPAVDGLVFLHPTTGEASKFPCKTKKNMFFIGIFSSWLIDWSDWFGNNEILHLRLRVLWLHPSVRRRRPRGFSLQKDSHETPRQRSFLPRRLAHAVSPALLHAHTGLDVYHDKTKTVP